MLESEGLRRHLPFSHAFSHEDRVELSSVFIKCDITTNWTQEQAWEGSVFY